MASTRKPRTMSTCSTRASSIRPRWCVQPCRTQLPSPASWSPPKPWSPKCRRISRPCRRCRAVAAAWAGWASEPPAKTSNAQGRGADRALLSWRCLLPGGLDEGGQHRRAVDDDVAAANAAPHRFDRRLCGLAQLRHHSERDRDAAGVRRLLLIVGEGCEGAEYRAIDPQPEIAAGVIVALGVGVRDVEDQQSGIADGARQLHGEARNGRPTAAVGVMGSAGLCVDYHVTVLQIRALGCRSRSLRLYNPFAMI